MNALEAIALGGFDEDEWDDARASAETEASSDARERDRRRTTTTRTTTTRTTTRECEMDKENDSSDVNERTRCDVGSERRDDAKSLAKWLALVGVLERRDERVVASEGCATFLLNGVALCALAERVSGERVFGVERAPKTRAAGEANVRRALRAFSKCPKMDRRFLANETLKVEDIAVVVANARKCVETSAKKREGSERGGKTGATRSEADADADAEDADAAVARRRASSSATAMTTSARLKVAKRASGGVDASEPHPQPRPRRRPPRRAAAPPLELPKLDVPKLSDADARARAERTIAWLVEEKLWPSKERHASDAVEALAAVVKRGVVLCDLASRVQRREIIGCERAPKTFAQRLHNVSIALRALRADARFPCAWLFAERALARGSSDAALGVSRDLARVLLARRHRP